MTAAIFATVDQPWMIGKTPFSSMSDNDRNTWPSQFYNPALVVTNGWALAHEAPMGGMQDLDLTMFQHDQHSFAEPGPARHSPTVHNYHAERAWPSSNTYDVPLTAAYPHDFKPDYHCHHTSTSMSSYNYPPSAPTVSAQSPGSSFCEASPEQHHLLLAEPHRPSFNRSITAPEPRHTATTTYDTTPLKRSGSDDGDDDYIPNSEATKTRDRKRQRIPHTAVERRYRENLNAHLEKLRQTVPSLAPRATSSKSGDATAEVGAKPSKCEILNGAIEHISKLDKENQALRLEMKALGARIEELSRQRSDGGGRGLAGCIALTK